MGLVPDWGKHENAGFVAGSIHIGPVDNHDVTRFANNELGIGCVPNQSLRILLEGSHSEVHGERVAAG